MPSRTYRRKQPLRFASPFRMHRTLDRKLEPACSDGTPPCTSKDTNLVAHDGPDPGHRDKLAGLRSVRVAENRSPFSMKWPAEGWHRHCCEAGRRDGIPF